MILDAVWIGAAFLLGLAARLVGLPPLVGYLAAGFVLYALGIDPGEVIEHFSELGVTLLLFTIGLKLRVETLLRPEIWGTAAVHMVVVTVVFALGLPVLAITGLPLFTGLTMETALLVTFALSYSSTVFAVKVLEERGEMASVYGRTAIGILIIQDIAAVIFLAMSAGKVPSVWSLVLIVCLVPLSWLLLKVMDRTGHAELLVLFGLSVALGGAQLFDLFSIKGDLGALIFGVLLARHPYAEDLSKALLGFKDLFLVGFFLSIGLKGLPSPELLITAVILVLAIPVKGALFFGLLTRFRMRSRTAFLASLNLTNYSEFGLIVAAGATANGWLPDAWLIVLAVAVALSFLFSAPLNTAAHWLYERFHHVLLRFQDARLSPDKTEIDTGGATVLVFGMGRVGTGAYDVLDRRDAEHVLGFDVASEVVERHRQAGRRVLRASATDVDFWSRLRLEPERPRLVMLAMPEASENTIAAEHLRKKNYAGRIAAIVKHDDDTDILRQAGVHQLFNLYTEAGAGFAVDALRSEA
ncbi:MAG: cation:proton antiporter family protein [Acidobacteriota bacterium]